MPNGSRKINRKKAKTTRKMKLGWLNMTMKKNYKDDKLRRRLFLTSKTAEAYLGPRYDYLWKIPYDLKSKNLRSIHYSLPGGNHQI